MIFLLSVCLVLPLMAESAEEALIKDLKKSLMAPCCWSGTVYDHGHSQMEQEIEEFVNEGKTKSKILKYYSTLYGERILASPEAKGFNRAVWIAPPLLAVLACVCFIVYLKKPAQIPEPVPTSSPEIPFDEEIERELRELDS